MRAENSGTHAGRWRTACLRLSWPVGRRRWFGQETHLVFGTRGRADGIRPPSRARSSRGAADGEQFRRLEALCRGAGAPCDAKNGVQLSSWRGVRYSSVGPRVPDSRVVADPGPRPAAAGGAGLAADGQS